MTFKLPERRATVPAPRLPRTLPKAKAYIAELERACRDLIAERDGFAEYAEPTLALVHAVVEHTEGQIQDAIFDHDTDTYAHKT